METTTTGRPGRTLTGAEFTELQAGSARHVVFSLTGACPLRCPHCFVPAPAGAHRVMSSETARDHAQQFAALRRRGIDAITLTGGEPLLAPAVAATLSSAAAAQGITTTVVTSCHWARSARRTGATIAELPHVRRWHLSTDVFHAAFVPPEQVATVAHALRAAGREVVVRMAAPRDDDGGHARLLERVRSLLPRDVPIHVQSVVGARARRAAADARPRYCVPGGLMVRDDGSFAPCCGLLSDRRRAHPYARVRAGSLLAAAVERWRGDPLHQLVQTVGFWPVLAWARDVDEAAFEDASAMSHTCDCCARLWESRAVRAHARRRATRPAVRAKVEALYAQTLGRPEPPQGGMPA